MGWKESVMAVRPASQVTFHAALVGGVGEPEVSGLAVYPSWKESIHSNPVACVPAGTLPELRMRRRTGCRYRLLHNRDGH